MRRSPVQARLRMIIFTVGLVAAAEMPVAWAQLTERPVAPAEVPELKEIVADPQLLLNRGIQKELVLSDKQVRESSTVVNQFVNDTEKLRSEQPGEANVTAEVRKKQVETIAELTAEAQKKLEPILSKPQMTRLKQLTLQSRRFFPFRTPTVQKALALTADQKQEIAALFEKAIQTQPAFRDYRKAFPDKSDEELGKAWTDAVREFDKSMISRMLEVLKEEQRTKWAKMIGPTYEFNP